MKIKSKAKKLVGMKEEKEMGLNNDSEEDADEFKKKGMFDLSKKMSQINDEKVKEVQQHRPPEHLKFQPSLTFMGK